MILSNDNTIENDINVMLSDDKIAIVMMGSKQCLNCQLTKHNILQFYAENKNTRLGFISVINDENDLLESKYYQLNELNEYPKTVIYHGSLKNVEFKEGVITVEDLISYENSKRC